MGCLSQLHSTLSPSDRVSLNLELAESASLTGQQSPPRVPPTSDPQAGIIGACCWALQFCKLWVWESRLRFPCFRGQPSVLSLLSQPPGLLCSFELCLLWSMSMKALVSLRVLVAFMKSAVHFLTLKLLKG